jgi:hypothetical protein
VLSSLTLLTHIGRSEHEYGVFEFSEAWGHREGELPFLDKYKLGGGVGRQEKRDRRVLYIPLAHITPS